MVTHGMSEQAVRRQVRTYLNEIIPHFNVLSYYKIGYNVAKILLNLLYKVSVDYQDEQALASIPKRDVVVYLMNHRSNADYVVVAYVLDVPGKGVTAWSVDGLTDKAVDGLPDATPPVPQATVLRSALLRRLVVGPEHVARHVLNVIDRDRRETFVPRWYRVAAIAQAVVPGLVARISGRAGYRGV